MLSFEIELNSKMNPKVLINQILRLLKFFNMRLF